MIDTDTYLPAVIIDLDGTLLKGNSFTRFTAWLAMRSLRRMRLDTTLHLLWHVAMRKMRRISHVEAKRRIMTLAGKMLKEQDYEKFAHSILHLLRLEMTYMIMTTHARSLPVCIATAAPDEYSAALGRILCVDAVVATAMPPEGEEMKECRGDAKRRLVEELCELRGWRPGMTITDHHDDIPLMLWTASCGGRNVLIGASESTRSKVLKAGIPVKLIP